MPIPILTGEDARLSSGTTLFEQGAETSDAYVIREGSITLSVSDGRQEYVVRTAEPGDLIGAAEVLSSEPHAYTAVSLSSARVVRISRKAMLDQLTKTPANWAYVLRSISADLLGIRRLNVNARLRASYPIHKA